MQWWEIKQLKWIALKATVEEMQPSLGIVKVGLLGQVAF